MTKIVMDSGAEFYVTESAEVVMETLNNSGAQGRVPRGRGPMRPGDQTSSWATFTKEDGLYVYLNVDHIAFVTGPEGT